jgi:hypothetical protein
MFSHGARNGRQVKDTNGGKLGISIQVYLTQRGGELMKNASIVDDWHRILPGHLHEACSLESISGGIIRVAVDSGPYMHELSMLSDELVQRLEQMHPRARVRKIKLIPRNTSQSLISQKQ